MLYNQLEDLHSQPNEQDLVENINFQSDLRFLRVVRERPVMTIQEITLLEEYDHAHRA